MDPLKDGISNLSIVDSMGSDESVVRAARVSFSNDDKTSGGEKLIKYLADHKHGTPFEHTAVTFHVACPLFVRGQWHRHRIGWSYNEVSRRYTSEDIQFYYPDEWRQQATVNLQGSEGRVMSGRAAYATSEFQKAVDVAHEAYDRLLKLGVSREQARMVLPQNLYIRFYATCNLRSAAHFINLRADEHAQWEIRQYAQSMYTQLKKLYPVSIAALCDPKEEPEPEPGLVKQADNSIHGR